jgi:hypothetical protein
VLVTLLYGVLYAILRAWLDYRVKMKVLETLDADPNLLRGDDRLAEVLTTDATPDLPKPRQDYALTGLLIAAIGIGCILFGRLLRVGDVAVGTYLGGVLCLLLGLVMAGLGAVIKVLSRDPTIGLSGPR